MPRHCSAGGCKSRDNRETRDAGITFHKLPKGATRRSLWITNSHRADSWDPQTDFVYFCSKHFTPQSFELTGCSGIRRLKEDAFPTVFDFSSASKCNRAQTLQTEEDAPVRKSPRSGKQENTQLEINQSQTADEPTVQRSGAAAEETSENVLAFSQEPSGVEEPSHQEHSTSPPESRPLSPSRYMRRLPPPLGFYLSKEHSYAQLCPLLWRRRYDQAVDCLEKALRQLHAARRRENRLRSTVLRLRDKRLKHTLLVSRDGCKSRGSWTSGGDRRQCKEGSDLEESETDFKSENTGLFEDKCMDQMELGCRFPPDASSWSEEEKGFCFYCGRGQAPGGGQVACRVSKTWKDVLPTEHEKTLKIQRTGTCGSAENAIDIQIVRLERPSGKTGDTSDTGVTNSQVLFQNPSLQHVIPAAVSLSDTQEQSLQLVGTQQKLQLSDVCEQGSEAGSQGHHLDLQHQLFWIQDSAEGQFILVPLPSDERFSVMKGITDEPQTIQVSELNPKGSVGHTTESSGGLSKVETTCDDEHSDQQSVVNSSVEMREDVREKLKEHLEGFHLQLSTEFRN